jgi:hypothetical protein
MDWDYWIGNNEVGLFDWINVLGLGDQDYLIGINGLGLLDWDL